MKKTMTSLMIFFSIAFFWQSPVYGATLEEQFSLLQTQEATALAENMSLKKKIEELTKSVKIKNQTIIAGAVIGGIGAGIGTGGLIVAGQKKSKNELAKTRLADLGLVEKIVTLSKKLCDKKSLDQCDLKYGSEDLNKKIEKLREMTAIELRGLYADLQKLDELYKKIDFIVGNEFCECLGPGDCGTSKAETLKDFKKRVIYYKGKNRREIENLFEIETKRKKLYEEVKKLHKETSSNCPPPECRDDIKELNKKRASYKNDDCSVEEKKNPDPIVENECEINVDKINKMISACAKPADGLDYKSEITEDQINAKIGEGCKIAKEYFSELEKEYETAYEDYNKRVEEFKKIKEIKTETEVDLAEGDWWCELTEISTLKVCDDTGDYSEILEEYEDRQKAIEVGSWTPEKCGKATTEKITNDNIDPEFEFMCNTTVISTWYNWAENLENKINNALQDADIELDIEINITGGGGDTEIWYYAPYGEEYKKVEFIVSDINKYEEKYGVQTGIGNIKKPELSDIFVDYRYLEIEKHTLEMLYITEDEIKEDSEEAIQKAKDGNGWRYERVCYDIIAWKVYEEMYDAKVAELIGIIGDSEEYLDENGKKVTVNEDGKLIIDSGPDVYGDTNRPSYQYLLGIAIYSGTVGGDDITDCFDDYDDVSNKTEAVAKMNEYQTRFGANPFSNGETGDPILEKFLEQTAPYNTNMESVNVCPTLKAWIQYEEYYRSQVQYYIDLIKSDSDAEYISGILPSQYIVNLDGEKLKIQHPGGTTESIIDPNNLTAGPYLTVSVIDGIKKKITQTSQTSCFDDLPEDVQAILDDAEKDSKKRIEIRTSTNLSQDNVNCIFDFINLTSDVSDNIIINFEGVNFETMYIYIGGFDYQNIDDFDIINSNLKDLVIYPWKGLGEVEIMDNKFLTDISYNKREQNIELNLFVVQGNNLNETTITHLCDVQKNWSARHKIIDGFVLDVNGDPTNEPTHLDCGNEITDCSDLITENLAGLEHKYTIKNVTLSEGEVSCIFKKIDDDIYDSGDIITVEFIDVIFENSILEADNGDTENIFLKNTNVTKLKFTSSSLEKIELEDNNYLTELEITAKRLFDGTVANVLLIDNTSNLKIIDLQKTTGVTFSFNNPSGLEKIIDESDHIRYEVKLDGSCVVDMLGYKKWHTEGYGDVTKLLDAVPNDNSITCEEINNAWIKFDNYYKAVKDRIIPYKNLIETTCKDLTFMYNSIEYIIVITENLSEKYILSLAFINGGRVEHPVYNKNIKNTKYGLLKAIAIALEDSDCF